MDVISFIKYPCVLWTSPLWIKVWVQLWMTGKTKVIAYEMGHNNSTAHKSTVISIQGLSLTSRGMVKRGRLMIFVS